METWNGVVFNLVGDEIQSFDKPRHRRRRGRLLVSMLRQWCLYAYSKGCQGDAKVGFSRR